MQELVPELPYCWTRCWDIYPPTDSLYEHSKSSFCTTWGIPTLKHWSACSYQTWLMYLKCKVDKIGRFTRKKSTWNCQEIMIWEHSCLCFEKKCLARNTINSSWNNTSSTLFQLPGHDTFKWGHRCNKHQTVTSYQRVMQNPSLWGSLSCQ